MTTAETLREARALIEDPAHWTTGCLARDELGYSVDVLNPRACQFCAVGALARAAGVDYSIYALNERDALEKGCDGDEIAAVNDEQGHAAVLAAYDKAIVLAETAA